MKPFTFAATVLASALVSSLASAQWAQQQPQQAWGAPPGQQQPNNGMTAGGLAPPGSQPGYVDPNAPSTPTERELEKADREDSGRGLEFFYINAEIGGQHLGLQTFKANDLVDAGTVETTQTGLVYGAGLGLRLIFITIGPRFRLANFEKYDIWTLNAEVGIHIPLGIVEPYFTVGGGYASMGSFGQKNIGAGLNSEDVDITGYNIRGGFGIDIYLSDTFSLGANLTGEMIALTRPGVDSSKLNTGDASARVYEADGSSIGAAAALTAVAGLHF